MTAYCSALDVKERLNINNTGDDALITSLISACSELVDRHCMWPTGFFAVSANSTRYYDASAVQEGRLRLGVPLADTTLTVLNGDTTAVTSGMYRLYPRNESPKWEVWLLSGYSWVFNTDGEISVTGKFGYSLADAIPAGIVEATAEYAAWVLKRYQGALQDATANFDLGQLVYSKPMPVQVKDKLSSYRNFVGMR